MQIDTRVVVALIRLHGLDPQTLAYLLHVPLADLMRWLVDRDDTAVPFDQQLEAVRLLGIYNDTPRKDRVHYWRIREPMLGSTHTIYQDLRTLIGAFGDAEVVHIVRETDPTLVFKAKSHFGLRFKGFYALLEVSGHPFRDLRFNPDAIEGLEWVERAPCVSLDAAEYDKLEPGSLRVAGFQQRLTYQENRSTWDTLQDAAALKGVDPAMLAHLVELASSIPMLGNATQEDLQKALSQRAPEATGQAPQAVRPAVLDVTATAVKPDDDDDSLLLQPVNVRR